MFVHIRRLASITGIGLICMCSESAHAQVRTLQACSQGPLKNCAGIRLTSQLGVGPAGTNRFEIGIQNLGSQTSPALATSIYFASFFTGLSAANPAVDVLPAPTAVSGSTVSDATPWSVFESGDAIFLSAPGNNGIGGCAFSAPVNGYGTMAQTCGIGQFTTFSFFTPRTINVNAVTLGDMEFVAIAAGNTADSCNDSTPCTISAVAVTPEPASLALLVAGFAVIAVVSIGRRTAHGSRTLFAREH